MLILCWSSIACHSGAEQLDPKPVVGILKISVQLNFLQANTLENSKTFECVPVTELKKNEATPYLPSLVICTSHQLLILPQLLRSRKQQIHRFEIPTFQPSIILAVVLQHLLLVPSHPRLCSLHATTRAIPLPLGYRSMERCYAVQMISLVAAVAQNGQVIISVRKTNSTKA